MRVSGTVNKVYSLHSPQRQVRAGKFPTPLSLVVPHNNLSVRQVPASADAEARVLLGLQAKYEVSPPLSRKSLRRRIVTTAEDFAASVRMAAQRRPKTPTEINIALIHGQEEIIALLRDIKVSICLFFLCWAITDVW